MQFNYVDREIKLNLSIIFERSVSIFAFPRWVPNLI